MSDELERVIRPIVEGQIRGFLKEHPVIVEAVDWYRPRDDKAVTFINSLAKRIVRDLTSSCPGRVWRRRFGSLQLMRRTLRLWKYLTTAKPASLAS